MALIETDRTETVLLLAALLGRRRDLSQDDRMSLLADGIGPNQLHVQNTPQDPVQACHAIIERSGLFPNRRRPSPVQMAKAHHQARKWLQDKIFVMRSVGARAFNEPPGRVPSVFFARGRRVHPNTPTAAVINSRKPRRLNPEDRWVRITREMCKQAMQEGCIMVASVGNYPYELVCAHNRAVGRSLIVVCDGVLPGMGDSDEPTRFGDAFGSLFPEDKTLLISPFPPGGSCPPVRRDPIRDACVTALAQTLWVAEIRHGGHMERLAIEALNRGRTVRVFQPGRTDRDTAGNQALLKLGARPWSDPTPAVPPRTKPAARPKRSASTSSVRFQTDLPDEAYLIHYTRSQPGPWPGQTRFDYYQSVLRSSAGAAHTTFDTLRRILDEGIIRASDRLIRGRTRVVSFTARRPADLATLIRWHPGLIRWTFEPYGLAFPRAALFALGARPVIYASDSNWDRLPDEHRHRFQVHEPPRAVWRQEREWRLKGDLYLSAIDPKRIRVIVPSEDQARRLMDLYDCEVVISGPPKEPGND